MPHRRKMEKGSFRDHFDGLVKQFSEQQERIREAARADERRKDKRHINDRLFDSAHRD